MATVAKIMARAQRLVKDKTFTLSDILEYVNEGTVRVAGGVMMPDGRMSPPLPDLRDMDFVTTSTNLPYVSLPSDYQRELYFAAVAELGDEENSGTLDTSTWYYITATETDHFYSGCAVGDFFYADAETALDANNKVKEVDFDTSTEIDIYHSYAEFLEYYPTTSSTGSDVIAVSVRGNRLYYQPIPSSAQILILHFYRKPTDRTADATYTASTISFAATTRRVSDSANGLDDFTAADSVCVSGSGLNDARVLTVSSVADDDSYIAVSENLVTEAAGSEITLMAVNDEPDGIPEHLQEDLLVNYAAWKMWEHIEQGAEGAMPQTQKHRDAFMAAVVDLDAWCPVLRRPIRFENDEDE